MRFGTITLATAALLNLSIMAVCLRERGREPDAPLQLEPEQDAVI